MNCSFTPYDGKQKYLFVSYSHQDSQQVYPILEALNQRGYRIWYDGGIEWGAEWPQVIAEHLAASDICLAFHSRTSIHSERCREELYYARKKNITVLSIYLEEVVLDPGLDMQLSSQQALCLYHFKSHKDLLNRLCALERLQTCILRTAEPVTPSYKSPVSSSSSVPRLLLTCISGEFCGEQFWIANETSIGRDSTNRVVLSDKRVSRKHCMFYYQAGQWSVRILGQNGILINQTLARPSSKQSLLYSGTTLTFFDDVFSVEIPR